MDRFMTQGEGLLGLSLQEFCLLGVGELVYVRSVPGDGRRWGVFSADGGRVAETDSRIEALVRARQLNQEPVSVH